MMIKNALIQNKILPPNINVPQNIIIIYFLKYNGVNSDDDWRNINALIFSGSNILFCQMSGTAERKRHNLAIEQLQQEWGTWNEQRLARTNFINKKLKEQGHEEKTFRNVDEAMQSYYYLTGEQLETLPPKPQLYDFLQEDNNSAIKKTELVLVGADILITGYLTYKFA